MLAKLNPVLLVFALVVSATACVMDSAIAQDPTPAPITVAVADITTAKVDGSWVVASETRKVSTVISIAGEASKAKYVFVILSGGAVAIELPTEDGRLFGVSGPAGKYTADILAFDPGKFQERIEFTIGKPSPDDDDDDDGGDDVEGFAGKCREWMKALGAGYSKSVGEKIAGNYASIASQGSDPARSQGWDLSAFVSETKRLNTQAMTTAEIAVWTPFLRELAKHQSELADSRGITPKDREKLAALWDETATAIAEALY